MEPTGCLQGFNYELERTQSGEARDTPGSPLVRILQLLCFHCRRHGLDLWLGHSDSQAWLNNNNKKWGGLRSGIKRVMEKEMATHSSILA